MAETRLRGAETAAYGDWRQGGGGPMEERFKEQLRVVQEAVAARDEEEKRQLKLEQLSGGQCKVVPHPRVATQPFRSERTVEQHSLFLANRYKGAFYEREWVVLHPSGSGEPITRKLTVGEANGTGYGVLKQVHQDVFYRLLQLWAQKGYPLLEREGEAYGFLKVSAYELVMAIRSNDSAPHYRRTEELLQELKSIPVELKSVYPWQQNHDRVRFSLLHGVEWKAKSLHTKTLRPGPGGTHEVTITFSAFVTNGFIEQNVKTLLGGPYQALGSKGRGGELAKLLYPFLDGQLATKESFHIKLTKLAERFGLSDPGKKSHRHRQFASAVRSLNSQLILNERYRLRLSLEESADGHDYVLTARREPNGQLPLFGDSISQPSV